MSNHGGRLPAGAAAWIAVVVALAGALSAAQWAAPASRTHEVSLAAVVVALVVMALEWPFRALTRVIGEPDPWVFLGPLVVWLVGFPWAPLLAGAAMAGSCALDRLPPRKWVFNVALRFVEALVTMRVMTAIVGSAPPLDPRDIATSEGIAAMLLGQVVWWAVAWTGVSLVMALAASKSIRRELTQGAGTDLRNGFLFAVVGPVVLLALAHQPLVLPLLVLPLAGAIESGHRAWRRRLEARTDALTGLPNRLSIYEETRATLQHAGERGMSVGMCLIDMDGFKPVNDTYGHEIGDGVLRALSRRLQEATADDRCFAGRLGGDEFFVLWREQTAPEGYRARAVQVLDLLRRPVTVPDGEVSLDASVGVVVFPDHGAALDTLLRQADRAMYRAKAAGGGVVLASADPA